MARGIDRITFSRSFSTHGVRRPSPLTVCQGTAYHSPRYGTKPIRLALKSNGTRFAPRVELGISARTAFRYLATGLSWVARY